MEDRLTRKLQQYMPGAQTVQLIQHTPVLLLVGPTGAGKDSLKDKLLATGQYHHIVSHTTRPPRINHGVLEQDGREYHFIDKVTAERMLDERAFVEAKIYSGNLYGTSAAEIKAAKNEGKIALTDIEVQGVAEYKAIDTGVMAAYLLPPSFSEWQERLQRRYGDVVDAEDARLRMQTALDEIDQLLNTDYYAAFINDDIEFTFANLQAYAHSGKRVPEQHEKALTVAGQLDRAIRQFLNSVG